MQKKVIITAALAGSGVFKHQNPALPYTPAEFAGEAHKAYKAGAAMVHVHAREGATGMPTNDVATVKSVYDAIRQKTPELIIQISSSVGAAYEDRIAPIVAVRPEMSSLNTNSMNFSALDRKTGQIVFDSVFTNTFTMLQDFGRTMEELGVKPEPEIYDIGGLDNWLLIAKQGFFTQPYDFNFVWGVAGGFRFRPLTFASLVDMLPPGSNFTTCGVGMEQFPAIMQSCLMGGNMRVGLEDNVRMPNGELARGSWEQVELAVKIASCLGREPATPDEARKMLGLKVSGE
jgi:3-keto-5-aminohexanoate cleavage enzyme